VVPEVAVYTLRTDGGARGNPGPAGAGFVLEDETGAVVRSGGRYLGCVTNNIAEYEALIWGLETALHQGVADLRVCADSELVVRQINGIYRVKNEGLKPLFAKARTLMGRFASIQVAHVRREQNAAADELANQAMDIRSTCGDGVEDGQGDQSALF
jgi:ribonuclease HI